jgi:nitric oxide reductase NorD protein
VAVSDGASIRGVLAGGQAALACLNAIPAAIRLVRTEPVSLAAWWRGLGRLARDAPALVEGIAARTEILLAETRLKDFHEPLTPVVHERIAGLSSGLSTRLGAALRHAGAELDPLRTTRKLVLVLTDGEPSDFDVADPRELTEDARRAVLGLRCRGIDVFGIVMDPQGAGSGSTIFGRHHAIAVRRPENLPASLAGVYFRLAQR